MKLSETTKSKEKPDGKTTVSFSIYQFSKFYLSSQKEKPLNQCETLWGDNSFFVCWEFCVLIITNCSEKICCPSISPVQNSPTSVGCCSQSLLSTRQCLPFCPSSPSTPDCLPQARSDQVLCRLSRLSLVELHRLCVLVFWNEHHFYWLLYWQCHLFARKVWKQKCFTLQPAGNTSYGMQG